MRRLYPGWQAGRCYPAPAGMTVLILHHEDSQQETCWWLSGDGELLACHALALPPHQHAKTMAALDTGLSILYMSLLSGEAPLPDMRALQQGYLAPLHALPASARIQLLSLWFLERQGNITITTPAALIEKHLRENRDESVSGSSAPLLDKLFSTRADGPHTQVISPFTGKTLRAQLTMQSEKGVACRFSDGVKGKEAPCFYLFWPGPVEQSMPADAQTPCLYYPAGNLLVGEGSFLALLPAFLLSWFIENPDCEEELLSSANTSLLEAYGVGQASTLWDDVSPGKAGSGLTNGEETGQMLSSFPFSSMFTAGPLPGRKPLTLPEDLTAGTTTDTDDTNSPWGTR